ncbi:MAG: hypothetical protein ACI8ZX_001370 [Planctomycetota bacterium]|jgi:hypothetical protein
MRIKLFSLLTVVFLSTSLFAKATGEELFKQCKACHTLTEDRLVGPGLAGVTERREHEWLKSWIRSSTKLIASGDADAIALFEEFKIPMADYDLSDEDMESLLSFIAGDKVVEEVVVEETVAEVKVVSEVASDEVAVVEEIKIESDWEKALKNRPLTKWLFGLSMFLLIGVLIVSIRIYRTTKEA